jgi:hypothetical protein
MSRRAKTIKAEQRIVEREAAKYRAREKKENDENRSRADLPALEQDFRDTYATYAEGYLQAGLLLQEIKKIKPWKLLKDDRNEPKYANFGEYCQHRFGFDMRQANHVIRAATLAGKLGEPYPKSEAVMRVFSKIVEHVPEMAKAARDKLYTKNPNPTAQEALDFLRDFLTGDEVIKLLPAPTQPKTVAHYQRIMEKQTTKILSELSRGDRSIFIDFLYKHAEDALLIYYGLEVDELEKEPWYQAQMAEIMKNSDDPALIEKGKQWMKEHTSPAPQPRA